jgi:hypothetical protein
MWPARKGDRRRRSFAATRKLRLNNGSKEVESMGKVIGGLIVVSAIWVGVEMMTNGPSRAFGGLFANFVSNSETEEVDDRSTARRSGDSVARARDEATARRERMLAE